MDFVDEVMKNVKGKYFYYNGRLLKRRTNLFSDSTPKRCHVVAPILRRQGSSNECFGSPFFFSEDIVVQIEKVVGEQPNLFEEV